MSIHTAVHNVAYHVTFFFTCSLLRLKELGITSASTSRMYRKRPVCTTGGHRFESVTFNDSFGAIVVLGSGLILAIVILLFEEIHRTFVVRCQR